MNIRVPCPGCSGTGMKTFGDRHAATNMDICDDCGGEGKIPARTGETPESSFQPPADFKAALLALSYQDRVRMWLHACFGEQISADTVERNHRFLEEALEFVQSCDCTRSEAHQLVDYVFGRPVGEKGQEAGGVMNTFAAACLAHGIVMTEVAETELARCWVKIDKIREKQRNKPKHSPLPEAAAPMDLGQVVYEARWEGMTLGPRGAASAWSDLHESAKEVWRKAALAARQASSPRACQLDGGALLDALGGFLHDEIHADNESGWTWPVHAEDDGYRGNNAFVTITPADVQARRREEAGRILRFLEPRASTEARSLEAACEPWRFGLGGPPDNVSPLFGVFSSGVTYAIRELGTLTNSAGWSLKDGSERIQTNVHASILDVLRHAGLLDPDTGRLASLTSVNEQGRTQVEEALTAQIRSLEASQRMDGLTAAEWQERWTEQGNTLAARIGELETENNQLRATLGNGNAPCIHCSLPREKWGECANGFPGCSRADDAMLCPHVGAELAAQEEIVRLKDQIGALEEQIRKDAYANFNAKADFEVELDALRLLLRRNEVRVGRQRELLQENNKLLDRARAADARAARFWAALGCLFPFVDRAVGEGIVFGPDGAAPAMDALDAYAAAGRALGFEAVDDPTLMALSAPGETPPAAATVPVLYQNYRGDIAVRNVVPVRIWEGESEWHPGERHFLRVVEPATKKVRDFAFSGILAWGQAAVDRVHSLDRSFEMLRGDLAAERDAKACGEIEVRRHGLDPVDPDTLHLRIAISREQMTSGGSQIIEPILEKAGAELSIVMTAREAQTARGAR